MVASNASPANQMVNHLVNHLVKCVQPAHSAAMKIEGSILCSSPLLSDTGEQSLAGSRNLKAM